ncbi:hypothetical protein AGMMS49975_08600 [Clostridia bacterium]|nr:hypothetical protein AGMMS49975_08600 [Clostridia bacterium]GHU75976.1 hypothetical protein FACS1894188_07780 [Clostridia bacterium]
MCKSKTNVKIDGICAGIAKHFGIDVSILRIIWLILFVKKPKFAVPLYLICSLAMRREE